MLNFFALVRPGKLGMIVTLVAGIFSVGSAWFALDHIRENTRKDLATILSTTLHTTLEGLYIWSDERKSELAYWTEEKHLHHLIRQQLNVPRNAPALRASPVLLEMRKILEPVIREKDFNGFFVIAPDYTNIASMRDANIGVKNLLTLQEQTILKRAFAGEVLISMPQTSDVPLSDRVEKEALNPPTMFVVGPVLDEKDEVIAVLAMRIFPSRNFTRLTQLGRISQTGETYIFNSEGMLLTESRFDEHLRDIGLIAPRERGVLHVSIRDPGGNMVEGFRPSVPRSEQPFTLMAQSAMHKESGNNLEGYNDYRGVPVIGVWAWDEKLGFGITTEIDVAEAYATYDTSKRTLILVFVTMLLVAMGLSASVAIIYRRSETEIKALARFPNENPHPVLRVDRYGVVEFANIASQPLLDHWNIKQGDILPDKVRLLSLNVISTGNATDFDQHIASHTYILTVTPILEYQCVNIYGRDVSDARKIRTEMKRLVTVIEEAGEAILITDLNGIIEYVNPAFTRISGYSADEALGKTPQLVKSDEHPKSYYQSMWHQLNDDKPWSGTFVNRRKDGELYEVEQSIFPLHDEDANIVGFAAVQRDVTERKRIQQQMEHSQRLESLGVLAGGIAHDFNNLLAVIMGNAALASKDVQQGSKTEKRLQRIETASFKAADLCRQMLAYAGQGRLESKLIDLSQMTSEMLELLRVSIDKSVKLHFDLADGLPVIKVDEAQIHQVVMNLVINASEAMEGEVGTISISTGVLDVKAEHLKTIYLNDEISLGRYVVLDVTDTGCGMDEETQVKIFDPFFTTKFAGRGLGMSAILGIVRGHQGSIKVYSEEGQGTSFKVLLPVAEENTPSIQVDQHPDKGLWRGHGLVLVVDDEETVREMASLMLQEMGFEVLLANDGNSGVDAFRQRHEKIRFVLMDVTMPGISGVEAFGLMKKVDADVKVILSSGYHEDIAKRQFDEGGLAGFVQKPYPEEKLQEVVRLALDENHS